MKKTATLLALASLSLAANPHHPHGSLRHSNKPETIQNDDELLLIYRPQYDIDPGMVIKPLRDDIDPGMVIRPPRDDIDRGIFVTPRPPNQILYVDDELFLENKQIDASMVIKPKRGDIDPKMAIKPKRGDIDPKIILNPKKDIVYADDELALFDIPPVTSNTSRRPMHPQPQKGKVMPFGQTRSRGSFYVAEPQREINDQVYLTHKAANLQSREGGGMFAREAGPAVRRADDADDELIMYSGEENNFPPRRNKIFDPKILTKPWYEQNQVMYADDELIVLGDLLNDN